jgi:pyruvate dehydrogenase E2 component (dihydrolipoyllysine-residue acetyltransferase)
LIVDPKEMETPMSTSVTMPALGESVSEGTVTRWLKQEGDQVNADEPLLEVSTDKVDTEIPSPASGVLTKIIVGEDETVEVGAELAVIGDGSPDGAADGGQAADQQAEAPQQDAPQQDAPQQDAPQQEAPQQQEASQEAPAQEAPQEDAPQQEAAAEQPTQQQAPPSSDSGGSGGGTSVTMPALGESVTEGTVTRWLKQEGDQVNADEPLLEVSTDKVDTEIPSPVSGVLTKIIVGEDETVAVGAELAQIGGGSGGDAAPQQEQQDQQPAPQPAQEEQDQQPAEEATTQQEAPAPEQATEAPAPQAAAPQAPATQAAAPQAPAPQAPAPQPPASGGTDGSGEGSAYVTPLVRKLATEHGVDLSGLQGTGVGGRIRKQDVLEAAQKQKEQPAPAAETGGGTRAVAPAASPLRGTTEKMSRLRKTIAARMVESLQVSAQLTTVVEVDLTRIARLRDRAKADFEAREGVKLSFLPFLAKATVEALKVHPRLNSSIDTEKGEITYFDVENLGVAVDTERGLLVPVIKEAGDLNIAGIARKVADLAARTRNNKITPDELGGGTFTLTNTGSRGALFDTPIINQPQVAILGTGAVVKRPVVVMDADFGETIAVRSMCYLALSYDHRIVDGADAARFLTTVKARLEEGSFEADLGLL